MLDPQKIKKDFPIFEKHPQLTYLDSGATSLKPRSVIDAINKYYSEYSSNIHRGLYPIAEKASEEYESTRSVVARFISAKKPEEIIFTRGTTEGINLVASTIGKQIVAKGDEIVVTLMEHHSNFVPWQQLALQKSAKFKVIDINDHYELAVVAKKDRRGQNDAFQINLENIVTKKTKILALPFVSNALGTINPVKEIIAAAKKINPKIITVVDAAQAIPHLKVDVQNLDCDFLAFSSHKMLGPTGIGVLWGKHDLLENMPPYQYGGDMILNVAIEKTIFNKVPHKFEAGTPHIAGVIGLKAAINYLSQFSFADIREHEKKLVMDALYKLSSHFGDGIQCYGPRHIEYMAGIVTFTLKGIHPHDLAAVLGEADIAVRAGHHCTMPLHTYLKVPATTRASFYIYNTEEDIDKLISGIKKAIKILKF